MQTPAGNVTYRPGSLLQMSFPLQLMVEVFALQLDMDWNRSRDQLFCKLLPSCFGEMQFLELLFLRLHRENVEGDPSRTQSITRARLKII